MNMKKIPEIQQVLEVMRIKQLQILDRLLPIPAKLPPTQQ